MPTVKDIRPLDFSDTHTMCRLDRYVSDPKYRTNANDVVREFVEQMSHENFKKFNDLPEPRQALLLRMYAEKHHGTTMGIVPYTS